MFADQDAVFLWLFIRFVSGGVEKVADSLVTH